MRRFEYQRASDIAESVRLAGQPGTRLLGGGTNLVDLMKCGVERPATLLDITRVNGLDQIYVDSSRMLIGSLARMSAVADHPQVQRLAPAISESLWQAASAQIRNMATLSGNVLQKTRCSYFRDATGNAQCNKRSPGSGCAALRGINRNHAVLGTSESCIAVYPGDFAVALAAFDGQIHIQGQQLRVVRAEDFFRAPGSTPDVENDLKAGEVITAIEIPVTPALQSSHYLKVRDRASYEFAAASAAAGVELENDGQTIKEVRIALGGVATKPWRLRDVEISLIGQHFTEPVIRQAAMRATDGAQVYEHNAYKIALIPRVVTRALLQARRSA